MDKGFFERACREGGASAEQALASLYRDYGGALCREAARVLRDAEAARDVLQETLLKAWRACASYRGESELFPWLQRILRRNAIDMLRRARPEVALDDDQGTMLPEVAAAWSAAREDLRRDPDAMLADRQAEEVFRRCAMRFATEQPQAAAIVRWIAEDGLSPADIAVQIGRSPGATREYVSQCRKKARHYFAEWYRLVAAPASASADGGADARREAA